MKRCWLAIVFVLAGCASTPPAEHLQTFPLIDDRATMSAVAESLRRIHDLSAEGDLELTAANGEHVRLDAALAMQPPTTARVRAWKFGQAVLDLTIRPDGAWLTSDRDHAAKIQVTAQQLTRSLAVLSGEVLSEPNLQLKEDGGSLIVRRVRSGEATVECTIDRATRTIRRYALLDENGAVRFTIVQSEFVEHDGVPWPNHIDAQGDNGRIVIELRDVDINGGLPPGAFVPPTRATRLP